MSVVRCGRRRRSSHRCTAVLTERHDRHLGRITLVCVPCARFDHGICQDCPRPVDGRAGYAERCGACRRARRLRDTARYCKRHHERRKKQWRAAAKVQLRKRQAGSTAAERNSRRGYARAAALSPERRLEISRLACEAKRRKRATQLLAGTIAEQRQAS